ncbi:hypothetical protein [Streptomyces sp. NPDC001100]
MSRLEITRETMTEILSGDEAVTVPGAGTEPEAGGPEEGPIGMGSPVGGRLVPPWTPGPVVGVLPRS